MADCSRHINGDYERAKSEFLMDLKIPFVSLQNTKYLY